MNTVGYFIKLVFKRKYLILLITTITILLTYLLTSPIIKKPLYIVDSEFCLENISKKVSFDLTQHLISFIKNGEIKDQILADFGGIDDPITNSNYNERVFISKSTAKRIKIAIKHESAEIAEDITQKILDLVSMEIIEIISIESHTKMHEYRYLIEIKNKQIDSVKQEITNLDNQKLIELNNGKRVDNSIAIQNVELLTRQKILLEKDADFIFLSNLLRKHSDDLGFYFNNYYSVQYELSKSENKDVIRIIKQGDSKTARLSYNRKKIIFGVGFLSFLLTVSLIAVIDKKPLKEIKSLLKSKSE